MLENTLESSLDCKEIKPINPKGNQSWIIIGRTDAVLKSNTLATWWEELIQWKRPWCWERLKAGGEGDDRGWDGWMASWTWWTWLWVNSGRWWWTERPGVLRFMGLQRVRHDWATDLIWSRIKNLFVRKGVLSSDQWIQKIDELHDTEMDLQIVLLKWLLSHSYRNLWANNIQYLA